ncbi:MAG TPA: BON domain-containing protein, partial [Ignavibacteriaceae bacterium]|nr:BON domain-containing protein [Ignavibacteriaceae bacterium]
MKNLMKYVSGTYYPAVMIFLFMILQPVYASGSNDTLRDRIEKAITSRYDPSEIQVKADNNGRVILQGDVNSLYDKYRIYELASYVQGVKQIDNHI